MGTKSKNRATRHSRSGVLVSGSEIRPIRDGREVSKGEVVARDGEATFTPGGSYRMERFPELARLIGADGGHRG